ncbi:DUF4192 family protein [Kineococcus terrestris]|uniref:DUF4192 family protein n=1 Tax=Kineococcus terrestris TaxID=2044856 RepID=UPI0034DAFF9C
MHDGAAAHDGAAPPGGSPSAPGPSPRLRPSPAAGELVEHLLRDAAGRRARVLDVLLVAPAGWRSLWCADEACCPPGGRPPSELADGPVPAEAVLRGLVALPGRADALALPDAPPAASPARRDADRARRRHARRPVTAGRRREDLALWRGERARHEVAGPVAAADPEVCGRLLAALEDERLRDAVLADTAPGATGSRAADVLVEGAPAGAAAPGAVPGPATVAGHLALEAALGAPPDPVRARASAALAADVARWGPGRAAAPAWSVAAWAWWSLGDGVRAGAAVDAALRSRPDHPLARLLSQALALGLPPRRRPPGPTG